MSFDQEICEKCSDVVSPTLDKVDVHFKGVIIPTDFHRFKCKNCGWIWANEEQRMLNCAEFTKPVRIK